MTIDCIPILLIELLITPPPQGGYMGYIGICGPKGYGFLAVSVINRISILALWSEINRVWFLHPGLELSMLFRRSYFFIINDNTINKSFS